MCLHVYAYVCLCVRMHASVRDMQLSIIVIK